jgi:hypothetical protein
MAKLDPEQKKVLNAFLREAQRLRATPKETEALIEAGLVEANLRNPNYGDRDSIGSLQERSHYGSPQRRLNPSLAARRFLSEARTLTKKGFKGSSGQLAQAVQRSAFPERYDQRDAQAKALLRGAGNVGGGSLTPTSPSTSPTGPTEVTTTIPGQDRSADRKLLLLQYLQERGRPDALLNLGTGIKNAQDVPEETVTTPVPGSSGAYGASGGKARGAKLGTAGGKPSIDEVAQIAKKLGLNVGEHPKYGGVAPVHTKGSYHYSGRAVDISGDPQRLAKLNRTLAKHYGKSLAEMFYDKGVNIDNGKRTGAIGGHGTHVHVAV